ncbi:PREDICTED: putative serine protease 47 [Condylura cristata]|uniref:putative serine protease 47 n=1 Tax=Condylura cristata TaxID=143302 RepID=UPI0003346401|nr:PREDICTED: putative serine protease 47 [Condylura cristata]
MGFLLWLLLLPLLLGPLSVETLPAAVGVEGGTTTETTSAQVTRPVAEVCGKPRVTGKIYGGQDVAAGQWPWQASVLYQGSHLCGAVLIGAQWLLSTAHCFVNKSQALKDYRVVLGSTRLFEPTKHTQKMAVSGIIIHPDFEKYHAFGSDIAMLQLYLPVSFTSYVVPACLPAPGVLLPSNVSCWITGWGMLTEDTPMSLPFHLQEGKVNLIENKWCNILYGQDVNKGNSYMIHDEMLCAGDFSTGKAICQGDSGGPLVCNLPRAWVLVGLASWGLNCQPPIYPSVFTRVAYFTDWIEEIQRRTPLPDSSAASVSYEPRQAASPSSPRTALRPPQLWLPPLLVSRALW